MVNLQRRARFAGLLLNRGSTSEVTGGDSEAGVHFSLSCRCSINFNGETAEKQGLWANNG